MTLRCWLRTRIVIVCACANAVLGLSLSGCSQPTAPATGPGPAAASVGQPLTDEECLATGQAISNAVNSGDAAALDQLIDWEAINRRFTSGIDAPDQFRKGFLKGLEQSRIKNKGIANGIVDAIKKGGSYTLLHSHTEENRRWLLFRLLLPESGMNYHDFILARRPDGKIKAVDLYIYLSGELLTETFRRAYIKTVAQNSGGLVNRLSGADQKYAKSIERLNAMVEAGRNGQFAEALNIYNSLPDDLKKEKSILMLRLQSAQALANDTAYSQAIEDFRTEFPKDACIDIISIDYHILKKQYRETLECIDRLDQAVHGDHNLQILRASVHMDQNDLVAARADLNKALEADPGLIDIYWSLVTLSLKENNFDETLKTLRLIRDKS